MGEHDPEARVPPGEFEHRLSKRLSVVEAGEPRVDDQGASGVLGGGEGRCQARVQGIEVLHVGMEFQPGQVERTESLGDHPGGVLVFGVDRGERNHPGVAVRELALPAVDGVAFPAPERVEEGEDCLRAGRLKVPEEFVGRHALG